MSAASAKPAHGATQSNNIYFKCLCGAEPEDEPAMIEHLTNALEAQPAAERTALKALRAYCVYQRENFEKGIREKPTHPRVRDWSAYAVAYTDVINEIDAQERAGAKAK